MNRLSNIHLGKGVVRKSMKNLGMVDILLQLTREGKDQKSEATMKESIIVTSKGLSLEMITEMRIYL